MSEEIVHIIPLSLSLLTSSLKWEKYLRQKYQIELMVGKYSKPPDHQLSMGLGKDCNGTLNLIMTNIPNNIFC